MIDEDDDKDSEVFVLLFFSSISSSPSSSSSSLQQVAPGCSGAAVALTTVVKTTSCGDVSWSLAAMQAYQTLGCQTPVGAAGFGSTAFYGQSPSPHSSLPAAFYADGTLTLYMNYAMFSAWLKYACCLLRPTYLLIYLHCRFNSCDCTAA